MRQQTRQRHAQAEGAKRIRARRGPDIPRHARADALGELPAFGREFAVGQPGELVGG